MRGSLYSPKTSEPNVESAQLPVEWENRTKKWENNFAQSERSKQLSPHSPTCHLAKIWMNYFLALGPKLFKKSTAEIFNDLPDRGWYSLFILLPFFSYSVIRPLSKFPQESGGQRSFINLDTIVILPTKYCIEQHEIILPKFPAKTIF